LVQALIDYLNPPGVVPLQRVVDNFDGDSLNERWLVVSSIGASESMDDAVNAGWSASTGTTTSSASVRITFNSLKQYAFDGSVSIWVTKTDNTANVNTFFYGFSSGINEFTDHLLGILKTSETNYVISSRDTASNIVSSSVARDTAYHKHQLETRPSSAVYFIDDVLEAISTTQLPNTAQQPIWRIRNSDTTDIKGNVLYMEAYNT